MCLAYVVLCPACVCRDLVEDLLRPSRLHGHDHDSLHSTTYKHRSSDLPASLRRGPVLLLVRKAFVGSHQQCNSGRQFAFAAFLGPSLKPMELDGRWRGDFSESESSRQPCCRSLEDAGWHILVFKPRPHDFPSMVCDAARLRL